MKKIGIIILVLVFALLPVFVIAQPRYEAKLSFSVNINGESARTDVEHIYVYKSDVVDVNINVETNEDFFAGPLGTNIYFTDNCLSYSDFSWNESGRFYSGCKSYSNLSYCEEDRSYLKLDMIPTSIDCTAASNLLDESLVSMQFVADGEVGSVARVYIDEKSVRNSNNPFGSTYFACYVDNGDLNGNRVDHGNGIKLDLSQADINIKITDAGDVNSDGIITAGDALAIIQYSTGIVNLDSDQLKKADVNLNGKVNSSDGLAVLQVSTGINTINGIINI